MEHLAQKHTQMYTALWQEANAMYEAWAKNHGLSYCQLLVALSISGTGGCTQKEIASQWMLPKQTVNMVLKNFIERGWVLLSASEEDRRNKQILPTKAGKQFMDSAAQKLREHEQSVWKRLGQERAAALLENTALYNRIFKEESGHGYS